MSKKISVLIAVCFVSLTLSACHRDEHAAENAGRKIDQAAAQGEQKMQQATADLKADAKTESAEARAQWDDATITTKVKAALLAEPGLKSMQITVDTTNGVVTLSGSVDTPQLMTRATEVAQSVDGVKSVKNSLGVKTTS